MTKLQRRYVADIDFTVTEPESPTQLTETLLCLHGIGGDDESFLPQSIGLAKDYRVIAWNMPGYQKSKRLANLTFESLARSVNTLITKLAVGPVHIMGQSIGGMIAQECALRYADQCRSLLLVATTSAFGGRDDSFKTRFLADRLKPLDEGMTMAELARVAVPAIMGGDATTNVQQAAINSMSNVSGDVYRDVLECLVTFDRREQLSNVECPVCLIAGAEDTNSPARTMQKMLSKFKTAEYHEIAGAGHLVNLEKADEVNRITRCFLQAHA